MKNKTTTGHLDPTTGNPSMTTTPFVPGASAMLNRLVASATSIVALLCATASSTTAGPGQDNRAPDVPTALQVPDGQKVSFHTRAVGVQIYIATPSAADPTRLVWAFAAPQAVLFDNDGNVVGKHYAGPTWESASGSKIIGARVAGATVEPTAIPWLLLRATSTEGPGILEHTTFVQRVNTVGGLAPATSPTQAGQEARVDYTADYYFFRESEH